VKAYWDSAALVEATANIDLRQRLEREGAYTRSHSLLETFSALTAGGLAVRTDADGAARIIENFLPRLEFVELTPAEIIVALREARKRGVRGGRVHDFMHAVAAQKCKASALLTLDKNDFADLVDGLVVEQF
jgi:predicted nucleic acid-binding protein